MKIQRITLLSLACAAALTALGAHAQGLGLRPSGFGASANAPAPTPTVRTAPPQGPQSADYIVAVVNSEPVTNNEVRARMARVLQQMGERNLDRTALIALAQQVMERIITEKAQAQLGRELGIKVDTSAIDNAEQTVARQNQLTVSELRSRLAAEGMPPNQLRDDLRNQLLLMKLRDREVEPKVKITDADIDQYLQEQQQSPDAQLQELNLAQILVAVPDNASPAQLASFQAKADQLAARARRGDDFSALAREFSDGPERMNGGQIGLRTADRYPSLFTDAVQKLPVNGVAGPIRSGAGFHVLKVLEKVQGSPALQYITQSHARHILLRTGPNLSEQAAITRLADYRRRIVNGQSDFAALAKEFSQDGSSRNGGDLGWVGPGQFVPEFEEAMNALAPDQISDPVVSRFGVHLIQMLERKQVPLTPREQREMARGALREKKLEEAFAVWVQEVRGRAYVEFRDPPQ